jgi:hypothetical protein
MVTVSRPFDVSTLNPKSSDQWPAESEQEPPAGTNQAEQTAARAVVEVEHDLARTQSSHPHGVGTGNG